MPLNNRGRVVSHPVTGHARLNVVSHPATARAQLNLVSIQLLTLLDLINDIYRESNCFDKFDLLTPLMTFDPDENKYTCTPAKCIVPIQIESFYSV